MKKEKDEPLARLIRQRMQDLDIPSAVALERLCGFGRDTIRNILAGRTKMPRIEKLKKLEEVLGVNLTNFDDLDKRYRERTDSSVAILNSLEKDKRYFFPKKWLDRKERDHSALVVVEMEDDSMFPLFSGGDLLIVNTLETTIKDGGAFAIKTIAGLSVRRFSVLVDRYEIRPENRQYSLQSLSADDLANLEIAGRVIAKLGTV